MIGRRRGGDRRVTWLRDAVSGQHVLGHRFVHADRRSQNSGADIGEIEQFEQTLDRAVLSHRAVEQRQDDRGAGGCGRHENRSRRNWQSVGFETFRQLSGLALEGGHRAFGQMPGSVAVDTDRRDVVAGAIDGPQDVGGRHARHVVFGRSAAEDDDEIEPRHVATLPGGLGGLSACRRMTAAGGSNGSAGVGFENYDRRSCRRRPRLAHRSRLF